MKFKCEKCGFVYKTCTGYVNSYVKCENCGGSMKIIQDKSDFSIKHAPPTYQSDKTFDYLTHTQALEPITGSPWDRNSGFSLADVRKKVGEDLVDDPGMPEMIYLPSEVRAAELRAELMAEKIEDIVVTLVYKTLYDSAKSGIYVESLRYSQVIGRVHELQEKYTDIIKVLMVYSEETHQLFGWNDLMIDEKPRLPQYGQEYERKRKGYRTTVDGVL